MTPLYTEQEFLKAKSREKLPLKCEICESTFYKIKKVINDKGNNNSFCSLQCYGIKQRKRIEINCTNCLVKFVKKSCDLSASRKNFCSKSCAAIYNNAHKTIGTRRSKLEMWLETKLKSIYPNKNILFNDKTTINSELDIYFPDLNLAFELNGVFHYEPIYGIEKLQQIQNNDNRKFQACLEKQIELCIIDTSNQKYFKEQTANKYLDIIIKIIQQTKR